MHRYGIENEMWFELARAGLERRGFRLRVQKSSIVVEKEDRLPRLLGSAREFLEFAERQGLRVEQAAYAAADRYGNARSNLVGRATQSQFEPPPPPGTLPLEPRIQVEALLRSPPASFGRAGLAEAARAPAGPRLQQERAAADRRRSMNPATALRELEEHCTGLEKRNAALELRHTEMRAELARAAGLLTDAVKQRDLYQMSAIAAEERARHLQAELDGPSDERGPDRKFNQLRRYLARELHPDLAGEDAAERVLRETIFKRVWAKIEKLQ